MGAFEEYLGALNDRAQMEHDAYVQDYVQKQQVAQNVMNTIGQIGEAIKQDRQTRGEYEQAVNVTGAFKPEDMILNNFVTPHEKQVNALTDHINQQNMQNSLTIQNLMKAKATGILTPEQQKNLDDAQAKQIDYARQLNDAGQQIEQYKQTPEYQDAVYNAKRQMFYKQYPVYSQKYYEAIQGARDILAEREARRQGQLYQMSHPQAVKTPTEPKSQSIDWSKEYDSLEGDFNLSDDQKSQAKTLTQTYADKYKDITDPAQINKIKQSYDSELLKIKNAAPKDDTESKTQTHSSDIFGIKKRQADQEAKKKAETQALIDKLKQKYSE